MIDHITVQGDGSVELEGATDCNEPWFAYLDPDEAEKMAMEILWQRRPALMGTVERMLEIVSRSAPPPPPSGPAASGSA